MTFIMKPINQSKPTTPISPVHPRRVLARLAVLATCIFALNGTAWGQSSSQNSRAPINLPPLSYTGAQFIDNNHCVFLRAGYGGNIVWVPRVSRNREPLCDDRLTPTFAPKPKPAQTAQTTTAPISKRALRQRAREEQRIIAALSAKEVATARADLREQRAAQKRAEAQARADGKIQAKAEKRNRKEALRVLREVQKADAQKQNTQTKTPTQPQKPAPPTGLISLGFYVSVTGFDSEGQAHNLRDWFKQSGYSTKIGLDGNILTVIIGPFPSALDAKAPFHQARAKGYTQTIIAERYKRNRHSG
ncbi:MAG: SPOR domain-containing protein [Candidatus Halichondribacter symbioticus]